jgi:hypothetical protein
MDQLDGGADNDGVRHRWWQRRRRSGTSGAGATHGAPRRALVMAAYICPVDPPCPGGRDVHGDDWARGLGSCHCN